VFTPFAAVQKNYGSLKKLLFADTTVVLSEDSLSQLRRLGIEGAVKIQPAVSCPSQEELARIDISRWAHLTAKEDACILYAGDYEFSEGHGLILETIPSLLKFKPNIKFIFACRSKTPQAKAIEVQVQRAAENGGFRDNIVFLGEVDDMPSLIRACEIVVFPVKSLYRKMDIPLVLLEAMALERPIVCSHLPPLQELVSHGGGITIDPNQPAAFIQAVQKLLTNADLRLSLGRQGRQVVQNHYQPQHMAAEYEKIYQSIASDAAPANSTRYYDQFSKTYESNRFQGYHALLDDLEAEVVRPFIQKKNVLEVGCGTGLIMQRLVSQAGLLTGIDPSEKMLEKAKAKGLNVLAGTAEKIPFPDNHFDVTYSFKVLAHVRDIEGAMAEMMRVTKENGVVIAEFYNARSIRGLRWWLRKKLLYRKKDPNQLTEKDIYTRYDIPSKVRSYLPHGCRLVDMRGVMIWTPFAAIYRIPGLSHFFSYLEKRWCGGIFSRWGGFLVMMARKE